MDSLRLPRGIRARGTRRPLRVRPGALEVEPLEGECGLRVRCALPSGSYVTVLLESLFGSLRDASRGSGSPDEADAAGVSSSEAE